ncbi:MAG: hypothetical protein QF535_09685 [Anaerolineales bacterium]|nr:hypothetical protein [Anaerolineales bacterium]
MIRIISIKILWAVIDRETVSFTIIAIKVYWAYIQTVPLVVEWLVSVNRAVLYTGLLIYVPGITSLGIRAFLACNAFMCWIICIEAGWTLVCSDTATLVVVTEEADWTGV